MDRHRHYHLPPRKSKGSEEIEAKQVKDQLPFSASVPSRSPHAPPLTATVRHSRVQNANTRSQLSGSQSSSDQNRQHAFRAFQCCLESHGIARSMSRPSNPWDNALAESFFKTLKRELVNGKSYKTREEASRDVFKYIEPCCNRQRMHSSIGYNAPCDLERNVA
ncbi:integrase core domain-containing protein [Slackia isoflavoniconvertens]